MTGKFRTIFYIALAATVSTVLLGAPRVQVRENGVNKLYEVSTVAIVVPAGTVVDYAGDAGSVPSDWLLLDGSCVSRTTYAALFAILGTVYGVCDGSTTFGLPDARGRIIAGKDDMGGSPANRLTNGGSGVTGTTLGAVGGLETMMAHDHSIDHDHAAQTSAAGSSHTHSGTFASSTHTHTDGSLFAEWSLEANEVRWDAVSVTDFATDRRETALAYSETATNLTAGLAVDVDGTTDGPSATATVGSESSHTHSVNLPNFTGTSGSTGTGSTQGNVQPTIVLNKIIKV